MPSYTWTLAFPTTFGVAPAPTYTDEAAAAEPDWGFDIRTFPTLDMTWTPQRGKVMLADALARRLFTGRGKLWAFPGYGIDLRDYLNDEINRTTLAAIKSDVEGQLEQDERVASASAAVSYDAEEEKVYVRCAVDSAVGPFAFVLGVTSLATTLLLEV